MKVGRCVQQNFARWTRDLLLHLRLHLALLRSAEFIGADVADILTHVFQIVPDWPNFMSFKSESVKSSVLVSAYLSITSILVEIRFTTSKYLNESM